MKVPLLRCCAEVTSHFSAVAQATILEDSRKMTKRKWKRTLAAMLIMTLCAGVAGGCGKEQQESGGQGKTAGESGTEKGR